MEQPNIKKNEDGTQEILLPIFETGEMMAIPVKTVFYDKKSDFQHIKVIDTEEFGRCLVINDALQTAESDHKLYDRAILSLLRTEDRRLIILGGGDGYVAEEALERNADLSIDLAELDPEIVYCAKEFLNQKVFDDPRLTLKIGDGLAYIKEVVADGRELYDGLVCDFTGEPITEEEKAEFVAFFTNVVEISHNVVREGGWVAFQAGDSDVDPETYVNSVVLLEEIMKGKFVDVSRKDVMIPSYGERDGFLFGWKK